MSSSLYNEKLKVSQQVLNELWNWYKNFLLELGNVWNQLQTGTNFTAPYPDWMHPNPIRIELGEGSRFRFPVCENLWNWAPGWGELPYPCLSQCSDPGVHDRGPVGILSQLGRQVLIDGETPGGSVCSDVRGSSIGLISYCALSNMIPFPDS